jgi:hypothetical protein
MILIHSRRRRLSFFHTHSHYSSLLSFYSTPRQFFAQAVFPFSTAPRSRARSFYRHHHLCRRRLHLHRIIMLFFPLYPSSPFERNNNNIEGNSLALVTDCRSVLKDEQVNKAPAYTLLVREIN